MDEKRLELKAGAFALAALGCLVGLLGLMGELTLGAKDTLVVDFAHTGNVVKNAPVKLAGVNVGKVQRVELLADRVDATRSPLPVRMTLGVSAELVRTLRRDATVSVSSQGPLGEAYLELWPGVDAAPFDVKSSIRGTDAPRLDVVTARLARLLDSAGRAIDSDPDALKNLVRAVGGLSATADGVLLDNREALKTLTGELAAAAGELRALSTAARKQLEAGGSTARLLDNAAATAQVARAELPGLSKQASIALGGAAALAGPLSDADGQRLKAALASYQAAGEKVDLLATRADRILERLEAGEGTLGALAKDKQAYDDLKSLLSDLKRHPWKLLWKD